MENNSLISVILATNNTPYDYLYECIESIINQTYTNFEFIIIDDCSDLKPDYIINKFNDSRIRLIRNNENLGLTKSLNIGLEVARGEFIARMDADDISHPQRFEKQIEFLRNNSDVVIVGSSMIKFRDNWEEKVRVIKPKNREEHQVNLFYYNDFIPHPSAMIRSKFLKKYNIRYNEKYKKAQDYGLWVECIKYGKIHALEEFLIKYRIHDNQISTSQKENQEYYANQIRLDQVKELGLLVDEKLATIHYNFIKGDIKKEFFKTRNWVKLLIRANAREKIYNKKIFKNQILNRWNVICAKEVRINKNYSKILFYIESRILMQFNWLIF